MKRTVFWLSLIPLLLLASACGGNDPSAKPDPQEQARRYQQCMAEHGVEVGDAPGGGQEGVNSAERASASGPALPDATKLRKAGEACRHLQPDGGQIDKGSQAQALEQQRAYARCMRENGVPDFPDPKPDEIEDGEGVGTVTGSTEPGAAFDPAVWDRADEKCRQTTTPTERAGG